MYVIDDYKTVGKRLREVAGESWYPIQKDPPPIQQLSPCVFCGSKHDPETGTYPGCIGHCFE